MHCPRENWVSKNEHPKIVKMAAAHMGYPTVNCLITDTWPIKKQHEKELICKTKEYILKKQGFRKADKFYCSACAEKKCREANKIAEEFLALVKCKGLNVSTVDTSLLAKETKKTMRYGNKQMTWGNKA